MPDEAGKQTAEATDTSLHAYKDGREEDIVPGSRGVTGDQGKGDEASYQDGGHGGATEFGNTPVPADEHHTPEAEPGGGAGGTDSEGEDDSDEYTDPESSAAADAGRTPRGAPPA